MAQQGFFIGDDRSDVISIMGEPNEVDAYPSSRYEMLHYGPSSVTLVEGKVAGWSNLGGLILTQPESYSTTVLLEPGSSPQDALDRLSAPNLVFEHDGRTVWSYGASSLSFKDGELYEWSGGDRLGVTIPLKPGEHTHLEEGMTEREAFQLLGAPEKLLRYELSQAATMSWGASTVVFENGVVDHWVNGGNLPVPAVKPNPGQPLLSLGDPASAVFNLMGTPDSRRQYEMLDREALAYGASQITLIADAVAGWVNRGQLRLAEKKIGDAGEYVTEGSTHEQVLQILGTPEAILVSALRDSAQTWIYENDTVSLIEDQVIGWRTRGSLPIFLGAVEAESSKPLTLGDSKTQVLAKNGTPWTMQKFPLTEREIWSWQDSSVVLKQGRIEKIIRAPEGPS